FRPSPATLLIPLVFPAEHTPAHQYPHRSKSIPPPFHTRTYWPVRDLRSKVVRPTSTGIFPPSHSQKFRDNSLRLPSMPHSFQFSATHPRTALQAFAAISNPLSNRPAAGTSESTAPPAFSPPTVSERTSSMPNAALYRQTAPRVQPANHHS